MSGRISVYTDTSYSSIQALCMTLFILVLTLTLWKMLVFLVQMTLTSCKILFILIQPILTSCKILFILVQLILSLTLCEILFNLVQLILTLYKILFILEQLTLTSQDTFYLWLYGVGPFSERANTLPLLHGRLFPISSNGFFNIHIPQTG